MRIVNFLILFLSFSLVSAQSITIITKSGVYPNIIEDSCKIGYHPAATLGVDSFLGEKDLTHVPMNTGEIRVLQRGKSDFECFQFNRRIDSVENKYIYDSLFFDVSFDSKINFRPFADSKTGFELVLWSGELSVLNIEVPKPFLLNQLFDSVALKIKSCNGFITSIPFKDVNYNYYSSSIPELSLIYMLFFPKKSLYTNVDFDRHNETEQDEIILFPNPCQDYITVSCNKDGISRYKLYDTQGNLRRDQSIAEGLREFSISDLEALSSGLYVLVLEDQKGNVLSREKLLKE